MKKLKQSLIDTAILLQIFVRPEKLQQVFAKIKEARPSKLYVLSDAPRSGFPEDAKLNQMSKKIIENIDWYCDVKKMYFNKNMGMHTTLQKGLEWVFSYEDRIIFFEDDIVPSNSFFKFSTELLEKYKDDNRIHMICGMNHLGVYNKPNSDYFFSKTGSIWGFSIWKRTFETFDYTLSFSENDYLMDLLLKSYPKFQRKIIEKKITFHRKEWLTKGIKAPFELVSGASLFLNNSLMVIPNKNLISCIGISENSGHSVNHPLKLPKIIRNLFNMKTYELDLLIKHPRYIIADPNYAKQVLKIMGKNKFAHLKRKIETRLRVLFFKIF